MSMLAERRRKTRYVINPTRKPLWTTDSSGIKFGKELMEKMGWSAGKGLGAKEQGIQEPLKVSYKNDNKGMGFKGNEENWIEYQDEFNSLLNQLASNAEASNVTTNEEEKNGVMSLEEKSKLSKARVHYQKFTRGKDLSKYSEKDLSCILGTGKKKKVEETVEKETPPDNNTYETSFGVTTINSGSIKDYFKKKWALNNVKSENSNVDKTGNGFDEENQIVDESVGEKISKKRLRESEQELEDENMEDLESKKHKKKRRKRDSEEESVSKEDSKIEVCEDDTKSGKSELPSGEIEVEVPNKCTDVKSKKKKKKKDSIPLEETKPSSLDLNNQTEIGGKIKHKKKKKEKESEEKLVCKDEENVSENIEQQNDFQENSSKKKKKKDKNEETDNKCEMASGDLSAGEPNKDDIAVEIERSKKKKKKDKKSQDSNENNFDKKNNDNVDEHLVKKKKKKKDKEMENIPVENDNCLVTNDPDTNSESLVKEEKRKKKKFKESNEDQKINGDSIELELTNQTVEESTSKKKKKKTEDEENKMEEIAMELAEGEVVENVLPKKKKKKDEEITEAVDQPEEYKKKSKKSKKQKIDEESEFKEDQQIALESHEKISKKKKHKNKLEGLDVDTSETAKVENKIVEEETENKIELGETLIHSHKTELFKMKKPFLDDVRRYSTAKAMNLFCDAEIKKFKGSNLENIPGYGCRKEIKNTMER